MCGEACGFSPLRKIFHIFPWWFTNQSLGVSRLRPLVVALIVIQVIEKKVDSRHSLFVVADQGLRQSSCWYDTLKGVCGAYHHHAHKGKNGQTIA